MRQMIRTLEEHLRMGEDLVLLTIVASSGSSPRGAGARMLVGSRGRICGTIGGGAVEYRSIQIAQQVLKEKASVERDFTFTTDDVQNLGMICGGAVNVFFHYLTAGEEIFDFCRKAEEMFTAGRDFWMISELSAGGRLSLYSRDGGGELQEELQEYFDRHPVRKTTERGDYYIEQIGSSGRVYVFGGGHVAQELVPVLSHIGFRCVLLDDRKEFANRELFPDAEDIILCDFTRISDYVTITEEDYVCVMTRGHAYDTDVQDQMMRTPAYYIGVIGSRRKIAGVQAVLRTRGFTDRDFERVTTPIGLFIKAETPAEIAISIAGQMIEVRAAKNAR